MLFGGTSSYNILRESLREISRLLLVLLVDKIFVSSEISDDLSESTTLSIALLEIS